jgi:hypothetical protein
VIQGRRLGDYSLGELTGIEQLALETLVALEPTYNAAIDFYS